MRYIDYGTMQSDARRRVLEMQQRAQQAVYAHAGHNIPPDSPDHPDFAGDRTEREEPCCGEQSSQHGRILSCDESENNAPVRGKRQGDDAERALLLVILLLLLSEKADTVLILAILYLML